MSKSFTELLKEELSILREKYLFATDETLQDPVFHGVVRDFETFSDCLSSIFSHVKRLSESLENVSGSLNALSTSILEQYKKSGPSESQIISDCYKLRESSNQIGRVDAPHSALAKYRRDVEYNVLGPLRSHINNCSHIRNMIDIRNRRMAEVAAAEREGTATKELHDRFEEIDKYLFDWFMILEEHKGDIMDSLLQTLKYLEYEFFASSSHAIAAVLPARMEFRPMVEMTPKQLESQLNLERKARTELSDVSTDLSREDTPSGSRASPILGDYSTRLAQLHGSSAPSATPHVAVDILSLSSLLAQGFEEGPARKALRECNNDTQSAMELLLNGFKQPIIEEFSEPLPEGIAQGAVRIPTTLKRIQRIKEIRRKLLEKRSAKECAPAVPVEPLIDISEEPPQDFTSANYTKPELPLLEDLLFP